MNRTDILIRAQAWMATDPDPTTRAATAAMLGDPDVLRDHFSTQLKFGTAGMRGPLGPGPNRMNRALVQRVTAGVATHIIEVLGCDRPVIIGYDGRHGSRIFSEDAARILAGRGLDVLLYDRVAPTPEVAHALVDLDCLAGIVVTASHNPPADNGYKVFWRNGAQIIPPTDAAIAAAIPADLPEVGDGNGTISGVDPQARERYLAGVAALRVHQVTGVRLVYSAMHGVGRELIEIVLKQAGHLDYHVVEAQGDPHPDFPTVRFPNPEEPGALELSFQLARAVEADIILANDPDADRLAVAVHHDGEWRKLTGNQIGILLANDLLVHGSFERPMISNSIVSTSMIHRIGAAHGAKVVETLTGFKWIANAAIDWDAAGGQFVMGFEEALGYCAGSVVRDKDGISAALLFADMASACKADGRTLIDALTDIYREHGVYVTSQRSKVMAGAAGAAKIEQIMTNLRTNGPTEIAGLAVHRTRDVASGVAREVATGTESPIHLPPSNVLAWDLGDGSRILARPSGTEPKIKFYFEVREPMGEGEDLRSAEARADGRLKALEESFFAVTGIEG